MNAQKVVKRFLHILKILLLSLLMLIILLLIYSCSKSQSEYKKFTMQLYNCKLPKNTILIEKKAVCGKLYGTNGEHMDYFAAILVKSEESEEYLINYFESMHFNRVKDITKKYGNDIVSVEVFKMNLSRINSWKIEHSEIMFESLENANDFSNYYAITIFDDGYY